MSYLELKHMQFRLVLQGTDALWVVRFLRSYPIDPQHCAECERWYQVLLEMTDGYLRYLDVLGIPPEEVTHSATNHPSQGRPRPQA